MDQTFTWDNAYAPSLEYFGGDTLAAEVFLSKYALRNKAGDLIEQTPADMHKRLAHEFARIESKYPNPLSEDEIFELFDHFRYVVPQGSPMSAIGNPHRVQSLSNCFVIEGPYDSYGSILRADQEQAQIMKRRGGVGFDISRIRPKNLPTSNAAVTTDGIGVFMERYSRTCREVAQGGRRGALMLTIDVRHPEVETFINIKRDLKAVTGANISVRLTDDFMRAVKSDGDFTLQWPVDAKLPVITKVIKAREIWAQIIDSAWTSAEPGLLFWDTVKRNTPADAYETKGFGSISTNPCGEIVLSAYDACRLMVLNVHSYVKHPFGKRPSFDWDLYSQHIVKAQRLMDDLVDLELEAIDRIVAKIKSDPEPEDERIVELRLWEKISTANKSARRTGLGITALGDALAAMNVKYGSQESIELTEKIYKFLAVNAHGSSCQLAKERGAFPIHSHELEKGHPYLEKLHKEDPAVYEQLYKKHGRRNICLTTTAPAGSVSTLTQTTSGIEPAYRLSYTRRKKITGNDEKARVDFVDAMGDKWQEYVVYHHNFKRWMDTSGETNAEKSPYAGATAEDINWTASVDLQAAAQKWIEHSISKTCNVPENTPRELIAEVYMRAWEAGCKGFTVYRDNCRTGVLVTKSDNRATAKMNENHAPKRPKELSCHIHQAKISGESWTILVGLFDGLPYEVFGGMSKYVEVPKKWKAGILVKNGKRDGVTTYNLHYGSGDDETKIKDLVSVFDNPTHGAFTRTISLALRHGTPIQYVVEQLQKDKFSDMQSFSRVMARVLKSYIKDGTKSASDKNCSQCGSDKLAYQEGCVLCPTCGWSKCS